MVYPSRGTVLLPQRSAATNTFRLHLRSANTRSSYRGERSHPQSSSGPTLRQVEGGINPTHRSLRTALTSATTHSRGVRRPQAITTVAVYAATPWQFWSCARQCHNPTTILATPLTICQYGTCINFCHIVCHTAR